LQVGKGAGVDAPLGSCAFKQKRVKSKADDAPGPAPTRGSGPDRACCLTHGLEAARDMAGHLGCRDRGQQVTYGAHLRAPWHALEQTL